MSIYVILALFMGLLVGSVATDIIWMRRMALLRREALEKLLEIKSRLDKTLANVTLCDTDTMDNGTILLYDKQGNFLAQGTDMDQLADALRERYGSDHEYICSSGIIKT